MSKLNLYNIDLTAQFKKKPSIKDLFWKNIDLSTTFHQSNLKKWAKLYKSNPKLARTFIQSQTLNYIKDNIKLSDNPITCYPPTEHMYTTQRKSWPKKGTSISVLDNDDFLDVAQKYVKQDEKVAVLNTISSTRNTALSYQSMNVKAEIFNRSNLSSLLTKKLYKKTIKDETSTRKASDILYANNITVFRKGADKQYQFLSKAEQFKINVLFSSPFYELPKHVWNWHDSIKSRITHQLHVAATEGNTTLILHDFYYRSEIQALYIAKTYKELLQSDRFRRLFNNVVFVIPDRKPLIDTAYSDFNAVFNPIPQKIHRPTFQNIHLALCTVSAIIFSLKIAVLYCVAVIFQNFIRFIFKHNVQYNFHKNHKNISSQKAWLKKNYAAYNLGYEATAWVPYLKSWVNPKAYSKAFYLGFSQATENTTHLAKNINRNYI